MYILYVFVMCIGDVLVVAENAILSDNICAEHIYLCFVL